MSFFTSLKMISSGITAGLTFLRVMSKAMPREVLSSGTVKDLVEGSGIQFEKKGLFALKGIPGEGEIYAVVN